MLKRLTLQNVGPAPAMELQFGDRLNLLTGDNGLGKTFLLDIAWWALTRTWPADVNNKLSAGMMARPYEDGKASIGFAFSGKSKEVEYECLFDRKLQAWTGRREGRPPIPGLVVYAQVDGSFAIWDPARNYWKKQGSMDVQDRPPAYVFSPGEVWNGLNDITGRRLCNGLITDWAGWQKEQGPAFKTLTGVLKFLSPSPDELIKMGELTRISLDDVRDIPTLRMAYRQDVPVLHASSGIRRIVALCYLLVWVWREHIQACKLLDLPRTHQLIFLVDEIEAHLHPKWQRSIIRSLLTVIQMMGEKADAQVQLITATHSPLILASMEPFFEPKQDKWFDIDLVHNNQDKPHVQVTDQPFIRRGDVSNWLTSKAFDLGSGRSLEAEQALEEASALMSDGASDASQAKTIENKLKKVLGDTDPFWIRWRFVMEKKGWAQ
ncbi:MAG: AAA family ATPase [Magnetococcus sp. MYC-9]